MSLSSESMVRDSYRNIISAFAFNTTIKPIHEVTNTADKMVFITRGSDTFKSILLEHNANIPDSDVDSKQHRVR